MKPEVEIIKFQQFRSGKGVSSEGELIVEKPVELYVNGILWITFMCTPNLLRALAVGFLYNEGVIESAEQVVEFHICENREIIDVWLGHHAKKPKEWKRTSGCTGGYTALDLDELNLEVANDFALEADRVRHLVEALFESQDLYKKTGGVHTSILTDGDQMTFSLQRMLDDTTRWIRSQGYTCWEVKSSARRSCYLPEESAPTCCKKQLASVQQL